MTGPLATSIIIAALVLAAWCGVSAMLDRPPHVSHLVGAGVVEVALLGLVVTGIVQWAGGERPAEPATFVGYAITILLLLPFGVLLARLEPTRWGSAILAFAAVVVPVLVIRLGQVWGG